MVAIVPYTLKPYPKTRNFFPYQRAYLSSSLSIVKISYSRPRLFHLWVCLADILPHSVQGDE